VSRERNPHARPTTDDPEAARAYARAYARELAVGAAVLAAASAVAFWAVEALKWGMYPR